VGGYKHGAARSGRATPEYRAIRRAVDRCHNPNNPDFRIYGARGIVVCAEWRADFAAFFAHVGPRPSSKHSLDRIDVNGNYEPGNVRWATATEQALNRRTNHLVTISDETHPLGVWLKRYETNRKRYCMRISLGWSVVDAITLPSIPHDRRYMSRAGATPPATR